MSKKILIIMTIINISIVAGMILFQALSYVDRKNNDERELKCFNKYGEFYYKYINETLYCQKDYEWIEYTEVNKQ